MQMHFRTQEKLKIASKGTDLDSSTMIIIEKPKGNKKNRKK